MRTTLTIDDHIAQTLKKLAQQSGKSFKDMVNETLQAGLAAQRTLPRAQPYKLKPASMGGVLAGIDLDKALQLAETLENEEIISKLQLRK